MEAPLSVREFLKRFHLPQLVRISFADEEAASANDVSQPTASARNPPAGLKPDNWGRLEQHVKSDEWTYRPAPDKQQGAEQASARVQQQPKLSQSREATGSRRWSPRSVRTTPPCKRPALAKLALSQPFLLYKAYKKVDLCAYVIDLKNELCDKSGDPIYFPHNYPGWFSMSDPMNHLSTPPLETIHQVCQTSAQIFLTRDEILGYQLPSKLCSLTKLNDQLLALPLAVNLDKQGRPGKSKSPKASEQGGVSGIKQVVIKSGQVLKICGIYEDVLPLIEAKQHHRQRRFDNSAKSYTNYEQPQSVEYQQMAPRSGSGCSQHIASQQLFYQISTSNQCNQQPNSALQRGDRRLLKLNYTNVNQPHLSVCQVQYAGSPLVYAGQVGQPEPLARKLVQNRPSPMVGGMGQRYARCVLLNQRSIDRLTDCNDSCSTHREAGSNSVHSEHEEVEVLIPIDQRGRFYLCATNLSATNEIYCLSYITKRSSNLVFKLSQIMFLLNLSKRLILLKNGAQKHQAGMPPRGVRLLKMPLNLHLVIGPRPVNFSPSMFGSSSLMESYFRSESNVGGHSIGCKYNKSAAHSASQGAGSATSGPACKCALEAGRMSTQAGGSYGTFSAALRIERAERRDVLLACTIKRDPLVRLGKLDEETPDKLAAKGQQRRPRISQLSEPGPTDRVSQSYRLMALRETVGKPSAREIQFEDIKVGKSSFSRLRACRSLISLNGRRKRRPNIPNSMLLSGAGTAGLAASLSCEDSSPGGASQQPTKDQSASDNGSSIVMIEFDCNDDDLRFVRTFVESSIQTSSIPDLVLSRMEHCQKNSAEWERQLKLSYRTLSQDFDTCQDQMNEIRRRVFASCHLSSSLASSSDSNSISKSPAHPRLLREAAAPSSLNCTTESSASSCSSSGVSSSSSGERNKRPVSSSQTISFNNSKQSDEEAGADQDGNLIVVGQRRLQHNNNSNELSVVSPAADPLTTDSGQSSRLLRRLVHKILPPLSATRQVPVQRAAYEPKKSRPARPKQASYPAELLHTETLMNAKKIHKKLMASGWRHLSLADQNYRRESQTRREEDENDGESVSHLYESLEALNQRRTNGHSERPSSALSARLAQDEARRAVARSIERLAGVAGSTDTLQAPQTRAFNAAASRRDNKAGTMTATEDDGHWQFSSSINPTGNRRLPARQRCTATEESRATGRTYSEELECSMEPLSIEACEADEFVSIPDEDDDHSLDTELRRHHKSTADGCLGSSLLIGATDMAGASASIENHYVNLTGGGHSGSSLELAGQVESRRSKMVSRMERKLMRMRGRRAGFIESSASHLQTDDEELESVQFKSRGAHSLSLVGQLCERDELYSINLPAANGCIRVGQKSRCSEPDLAGLCRSLVTSAELGPRDGARRGGDGEGHSYDGFINSLGSSASSSSSFSCASLSSASSSLAGLAKSRLRLCSDSSDSGRLEAQQPAERRATGGGDWRALGATQIPFKASKCVGQVTGGGVGGSSSGRTALKAILLDERPPLSHPPPATATRLATLDRTPTRS